MEATASVAVAARAKRSKPQRTARTTAAVKAAPTPVRSKPRAAASRMAKAPTPPPAAADATSAPQDGGAGSSATADLSSERLSGPFALGRIGDFLPDDLAGTAKMLARQARRKPAAALRATAGLASELLKIAGGESTLGPAPGDKRFADPAFQQSWIHRGWLKGYLAFGRALQDFAAKSGLDAAESERAGFLMTQVAEALAPTNFLLGNPAALRKAVDSGGSSLRRGAANLLGDVAAGRRLPAQSNDSGFTVGVNLAATPGAVVLRTEMFELLQYAPQTPQVRRRPTLIVPSIVNKYYAC